MSDQAFIRAICLKPADDLPRLTYADWLMENGQDDRAEFIRAQCELELLPAQKKAGCSRRKCLGHALPNAEAGGGACKSCRTIQSRKDTLRRRELELFHPTFDAFAALTGFMTVNLVPTTSIDLPQPWGVVRRGFVEELAASWADCSAHLDAIRQRTPIRKVVLSDEPVLEEFDQEGGTEGMAVITTWQIEGQQRFGTIRHPLLAEGERPDLALLLGLEFEGIEFELPPEPTYGFDWRQMTDIAQHDAAMREAILASLRLPSELVGTPAG